MREVIDCAIIQNRKLVVVRKKRDGKSSWILPGGKLNGGESDLECLSRELGEELPFLKLFGDVKYYGTFQGVSPNKGDVIENRVYTCEMQGELDLRVSDDSNEPIKEAKLLAYEELFKLPLSDTTRQIVNLLKRELYF